MNTLLSGERNGQNPASGRLFGYSFVRKLNEDRIPRCLSYHEYLLSSEWRVLRRMVITRCKDICEYCGVANVEEVHHLTYKRFKHEQLRDLIGVCRRCHEKIHNIKNNHLIPLVFGGDGVSE